MSGVHVVEVEEAALCVQYSYTSLNICCNDGATPSVLIQIDDVK